VEATGWCTNGDVGEDADGKREENVDDDDVEDDDVDEDEE
jgi:hypothetical protein